MKLKGNFLISIDVRFYVFILEKYFELMVKISELVNKCEVLL